MKLLRIGFIAALTMAFAGHALAADAPKIDPAARAKAMKEAPAVVQQLGLDCAISDANFIGTAKSKNTAGKDVDSNVYEVACGPQLGYFIVSVPGGESLYYDCLSLRNSADAAAAAAKGGKPAASNTCSLPGNADPKVGLTGVLAKAGTPCTVATGRYIGSSAPDKISLYEAHCTNGHGYVVTVPRPGSTHTLKANDCYEAGLFSMKCQLTSDAEVSQQIVELSKVANQPACQPNAGRWVVSSTTGDRYFEIACTDGKSGYIFQVAADNSFKMAVPCAKAEQLAGGCTLTNIDVAKTQEFGLYTQQAKTIGYPCTVSSYHSLGAETAATHREVVELACKEHPGSVWTLLPTGSGGDAIVVDCLRSEAYGLPKCQLAPMTATYADLGAQIKAKGKTCDVTGARYIKGVRSQTGDDFVEVSCATGGGMVIAYTPKPIETVADVFSCKETAGTTRACTLKQ